MEGRNSCLKAFNKGKFEKFIEKISWFSQNSSCRNFVSFKNIQFCFFLICKIEILKYIFHILTANKKETLFNVDFLRTILHIIIYIKVSMNRNDSLNKSQESPPI